MDRYRAKVYAGKVLEEYVYTRRSGGKGPRKPRFASEEERKLHRDGISRRRNARLINANFGPSSYYSTLTFNKICEVHSAEECREERDRYWRRLRRKYPDAKIYMVYGQGKHTARYHIHMVSDGIPEEEIVKLWGRGEVVSCEHLRKHNYYKVNGELVDYGEDYTGLANYLFDHWQGKFGGHRWKATKNCIIAEPEEEEIKREYTLKKPPRAPKGYVMVEATQTPYNYLYFKFVKIEPAEAGIQKPRKCVTIKDQGGIN